MSIPLAAAGFGALVYGLSGLGAENAAQAPVPPQATTLAGAVLVGLFVWRQLALQRSSTPLLDLRTLTFRHFSVALGLMCLSFMALMGAFIVLPIYLQEVCGLTSLQTGLLLIPGGLTMGLLGPQVGKLYDRFGAPRLVVPGAVLTALCLALFALTGEKTSPWLVLALHVALSAGMAFVFTPVFTSGLSVLPPHLYPHGSAILGSLQQRRHHRRPRHGHPVGIRRRRRARRPGRAGRVAGPHPACSATACCVGGPGRRRHHDEQNRPHAHLKSGREPRASAPEAQEGA